MSVLIGFGKIETDREKNATLEIKKAVSDILRAHNHDKYDFFTDEEKGEIEKAVDALSAKSYKEYETADKAVNRPERYGRFSVHQAFDGWTYFVRCDWFHINTRHALSADGMALYQSVNTESFTAEELV